MVTSEAVGAQPPNPEVMVHLSTVVPPMVSPVTAEVSLLIDAADPVPEIVVQVPVSVDAGVLAASVPEVTLQRFCVGPATATVMAESTRTETSDVVGVHPPNCEVMVHLRTVVSPMVSPVTADVGLLIEVADPVPDIVVQVPVSVGAGALAASVPEVVLHRFNVGPASAIVKVGSTLIVTSEVVGAHPPN
jgi:hypothetical protein